MIRLRALVVAAALLVRGNAAGEAGWTNDDGGVVEYNREGEKEYVRDDLTELEPPPTYLNATRSLQGRTCRPNERIMTFKILTDQYGYETKCEWSTLGGIFARMPASNRNFADSTTYTYHYCVRVGQQYRLRIKDANGDGMCCGFGRGTYSIRVGNEVIYDAKRTRTYTTERVHTFRVKAPPSSSPRLDAGGGNSNSNANAGGGGGQGCLTVKVKADRNPGETSWHILNRSGAKVAASPPLKALVPVSKKVCLSKGQYEFVLKDKYGDGICCHDGRGEFMVHLDGKELFRGSHFQGEKRYKIQIKPNYEAQMSNRDREWLKAHNDRRRKYHTQWGKPYAALQWSPQLAADSKRWATKLLADCNKPGIEHEPGVPDGENLAKNKGNGRFGSQYPAENILTRWVEHELTWGYPRNAHLTQCLWRATKYVGCGEAHKQITSNGRTGTCRTQVCRYSRAGNCNMGQYNANMGTNWRKPMLEDYSKCGPDCAPEGCY